MSTIYQSLSTSPYQQQQQEHDYATVNGVVVEEDISLLKSRSTLSLHIYYLLYILLSGQHDDNPFCHQSDDDNNMNDYNHNTSNIRDKLKVVVCNIYSILLLIIMYCQQAGIIPIFDPLPPPSLTTTTKETGKRNLPTTTKNNTTQNDDNNGQQQEQQQQKDKRVTVIRRLEEVVVIVVVITV